MNAPGRYYPRGEVEAIVVSEDPNDPSVRAFCPKAIRSGAGTDGWLVPSQHGSDWAAPGDYIVKHSPDWFETFTPDAFNEFYVAAGSTEEETRP